MSYLRAKVTRFGGDESLYSKYIAGFNPNEQVRSLFAKILNPNENVDDFDVQCIYCGELLDADKRLSDYDIDVYSVLQFLVKPKPHDCASQQANADPIPPKDFNNLLTSLRWMLRSGQLIKLVALLTQREYLDRAVTTSPALGHDVTAYSVIQDSKMLTTLFRDRASTEKFLRDHPCVVPVFQSAIQSILGPSGDPRRAHSMATSTSSLHDLHSLVPDYTIDQEQDTDDTEEENGTDANVSGRGGVPMVTRFGSGQSPGQQSSLTAAGGTGSTGMPPRVSPRVSRHQLQAAIAQAQGLLTTGGSLGAERRPSPRLESSEASARESINPATSSTVGTRITPNALAQALASATSTLRQSASPVPGTTRSGADSPAAPVLPAAAQQQQQWTSQLAQLAEMGVTDELAARQALEATNGDVALAIQLLFG